MDTPVLLLLFNRPRMVKELVDALRSIRPTKIFAAVDGPRPHVPGEAELCRQSAHELAAIDWPCDVKLLTRKHNLGCSIGVSSAITWFFSQVDAGIILEDDVRPSQAFFEFCTQALDRYENDGRVMHVNGNNFSFGLTRPERDESMGCFFSRYAHGWGWATWARAWKSFSLDPCADGIKLEHTAAAASMPKETLAFWRRELRRAREETDTWDYPWCMSIWRHHGLCLTPDRNLSVSVGFGDDATHTGAHNVGRFLESETPSRINIDPPLTVNRLYDSFVERFFYTINTPGRATWQEEMQRLRAEGKLDAARNLERIADCAWGLSPGGSPVPALDE